MIEPIRVSFEVDCGVDHAFSAWTAHIDAWWPKDHTVSGDPATVVVLEPRVGGRIFERDPTGRESEWGEVTAWQPPRRLAYIWHIATDRSNATDVEISFVPVSQGTTRVEVEQRGWERLGNERGRQWRDQNHAGWDRVIPGYQRACVTAGVRRSQ